MRNGNDAKFTDLLVDTVYPSKSDGSPGSRVVRIRGSKDFTVTVGGQQAVVLYVVAVLPRPADTTVSVSGDEGRAEGQGER